MNILFACGGTGGHINPAIAVAGTLKARHPEANILFVGNPRGMEAKLVPKAGYNFYPIRIMGFQRQLNWFNIKYNLRSMGCFISCGPKIRKLIREFQPDVVMGTGGYVSGMVLEKAHAMGVKTICHEQNAYPGVSNRMTAKFADKVLLAVEDAKEHMPPSMDYAVTGNPVREDIIFADRERARKALGVGDRFCILTFGGSLGARRINEAVADLMAWHCGGPDSPHPCHWLLRGGTVPPAAEGAGGTGGGKPPHRYPGIHRQHGPMPGCRGPGYLPGGGLHHQRTGGGWTGLGAHPIAQCGGQSPILQRLGFGKAGGGHPH